MHDYNNMIYIVNNRATPSGGEPDGISDSQKEPK